MILEGLEGFTEPWITSQKESSSPAITAAASTSSGENKWGDSKILCPRRFGAPAGEFGASLSPKQGLLCWQETPGSRALQFQEKRCLPLPGFQQQQVTGEFFRARAVKWTFHLGCFGNIFVFHFLVLWFHFFFFSNFFSPPNVFWPFQEMPNWNFQPFLSFPKRRALKEMPNWNFWSFLSFPQRTAFTWCLPWTLLTKVRLKIPWTS